MKRYIFLFLFFFSMQLHAGSVRLLNDSPYPLRAVVRGNDGTFLGEMVLNAQHGNTWSDSYGQIGYFGKGNAYQEQSTRSQTPYTVLWYCMDGSDYSFCSNVSSAATVTAQTCNGTRLCKPEKKQEGAFPNQPEGQYLQKQEEANSP